MMTLIGLRRCARFAVVWVAGLGLLGAGGQASNRQPALIIDHNCTMLERIPAEWIEKAKQTLHVAYGFTSHGGQLVTGMTGLISWEKGGSRYAFNSGGQGEALDLRAYRGNFGGLGIANDLNSDAATRLDYTAWEKATRAYLATDPGVNVVMWAWCYGVNTSEANINTYLRLMSKLEKDYPHIKFVYMTGRTGGEATKSWDAVRNKQIRDYCRANDKILYDFYDIESFDPDGNYYADKLCNDACDYDSDGDGVRDRNWAVDWQNAHPGEWFDCPAAHTQPLNANLKAYAAWWLWARLAGWDGR